MARVQADDVDAFGQLYDRYARRAYRMALTVCRDHPQAEDAVQEAFVSIWRGRMTYRKQRGSVGGWLLTVVHHRSVDVARRARPMAELQEDDLRQDCLVADDVASRSVDRDEAGHLRGIIARLPAGQREVLVLAFFGQQTHVEIAAQLDLPVGTVKSRIRLALAKLRNDLDPATA